MTVYKELTAVPCPCAAWHRSSHGHGLSVSANRHTRAHAAKRLSRCTHAAPWMHVSQPQGSCQYTRLFHHILARVALLQCQPGAEWGRIEHACMPSPVPPRSTAYKNTHRATTPGNSVSMAQKGNESTALRKISTSASRLLAQTSRTRSMSPEAVVPVSPSGGGIVV